MLRWTVGMMRLGRMVAVAGVVFGQAPPPVVQTLALSHANVIDGTGAAAMRGSTILIRNGRISAVYPSASRPDPAGAVEDVRNVK